MMLRSKREVGDGQASRRTPALKTTPNLFVNPCGFRPILENILDWMSVKDMKNLRLVSKAWDFAVRPRLLKISELIVDLDVPLTRTTVADATHVRHLQFNRVFLHFSLEDFRKKSTFKIDRLEATFPSKSKLDEEPAPFRIHHLYLTLSVLIDIVAVDDLISWLEVYGASVESLRIDKQGNPAFRRTLIGTCPSLLNLEGMLRILRTMPQVRKIHMNSFRLLSTQDQLEKLLVVPPFPVPIDTRRSLGTAAAMDCHPSVKSLSLHDVFPSHKNADFIRSFSKLEKLSLSFSAYAKPGLKLEALGIQRTLENLVELELYCESGGITQFGATAVGHLAQIPFRRLEKLKVDRVRFADGDNTDEQLSLECLLAFLNQVKGNLNWLDLSVQCSRVSWDRFCSAMPQMDKLKTLGFKLFGESSRDPLLQMLHKVPLLERLDVSYLCFPLMFDRRNLKGFRLINHEQLPYGSGVKRLSIEKIESPIARPAFTQLLLCFHRITHLDIPVWSSKSFSLRMHWESVNQLPELRDLKLRMMRIAQKDFEDWISRCKNTELSSLSFVNIKQSNMIKLKFSLFQKSFQDIPNLKFLELRGLYMVQEEDKTNIEQFFACKSPSLCVKIIKMQ